MEDVRFNTTSNVSRVRELVDMLRDNSDGVVAKTVDELERLLFQNLASGTLRHCDSSSNGSRSPMASASKSVIRVGTAIGCCTRLGSNDGTENRFETDGTLTSSQVPAFTLASQTSATISSVTIRTRTTAPIGVGPTQATTSPSVSTNASGPSKLKFQPTVNLSFEQKQYMYHRYTDELKKFLVETAQKYQDITGRYSWDSQSRRYDFGEVANMLYLTQIIYNNNVSINRAFLGRMEEMLVLRVEVASHHDREARVHDKSVAESNDRHYFFNQRVDEVIMLLRLLPLKES